MATPTKGDSIAFSNPKLLIPLRKKLLHD